MTQIEFKAVLQGTERGAVAMATASRKERNVVFGRKLNLEKAKAKKKKVNEIYLIFGEGKGGVLKAGNEKIKIKIRTIF